MEDSIDPGVGFMIDVDPGDAVKEGDVLATIYARTEAGIAAGKRVLAEAITIGDEAGTCLPLISRRITADGVAAWARPAV